MNHSHTHFSLSLKCPIAALLQIVVLLLGGLALPVAAQTGVFVLQPIDEWGSGLQVQFATTRVIVNPIPRLTQARMAADPISGITTLQYTLSDSGQTAGDLFLTQPGTGTVEDILRFDGQGHLFFFSLIQPGQTVLSLADVPSLPPLLNNQASQEIVVPNGVLGNEYVPAPGQPGYWNGFGYGILVDVPEPSAFTLIILAFALVLPARTRLQNACSRTR